MGKIIAFSNQKGGSGKSTLSANLAVLWGNSGYKVAVIDADAQKSLTYWLDARKKYYGEDNIGLHSYNFDIRSRSLGIQQDCSCFLKNLTILCFCRNTVDFYLYLLGM